MTPGESERPIDVAIIGGGCAAVTAAFELTRPEHRGRHRVTIYQLGFRLGGKGASGRGPAQRIEEHGLHLWMGFYENAFRAMRECYAELGRDPAKCPIATFDQAFVPDHFTGIADWSPSGRWIPWRVNLPPFPGLPGDLEGKPPRWTVADYLARTISLLRTVLEAVQLRAGEAQGIPAPRPAAPAVAGSPEAYLEGMSRFLKYGQLATLTAVVEALNLMEIVLGSFRRYPENLFLRFHDAVAHAILTQLEALVTRDDELRRLWEIVDLVLAVVRGSIRFRLLTDPRGFDAVNDYDCREWLKLNGAADRSINSAFVRALYDLAFAYEDGDIRRPRIAAGQALRGALRAFFTYRGAFFWKMQAGMGDIVFAPFYEVLKRRGVRFEFFHRLENVKLASSADIRPGEKPYVEALEFDVQAEIEGGGEYQPLIDIDGLPCWPADPDWKQLKDGERLRAEGWKFESHWDKRKTGTKTLRVGEDFDLVLLAVGVGAVRHVTRELIDRDPRWRTMVDNARSVPTQAFQIWASADMKDLGWDESPINISGFVEPFDTWADMTHLVPVERWPEAPRSIAYFCSVLADAPEADQARAEFPVEKREEVRRNAVRFLDRDVVHLWPKAQRAPGEFRWEILMDHRGDAAPEASGWQRFESQYWTANVNPTDRYALSLPGTLQHRISPLDHTYDNFTIAGDWTDCGFNEGCVEAAVMSGLLAAHALSGSPRLDEIVGYDHP
ncbi:MAG: NAD(P)-binding protein [Minicystis sp.]